MCYAGTPFFEAIEEMYKKIRPSLPKKNVEFFSQIREGFAAPSRVLLDHGSHYKTIQKITKAILASYMLAFTLFLLYRNTKEDRSVDRYSLQVYEESIYLVGYCHSRKEIRALAVQRMENVTVTDRAFTAKEEFSLDEYLAQPFNVFSGDAHKVVMLFSPAVAALVKERKYHPTQTTTEEKDGSVVLTTETGGIAEVRRWVLSFGADTEVLEPAKVRGELRDALSITLGKYP